MSKQIKVCMSNKYWWIIILYFLLFQLGGLVKNGSMNYYCTWVFEGIDGGTAMGLLGAIGGIPTAIGMGAGLAHRQQAGQTAGRGPGPGHLGDRRPGQLHRCA